MEDDLPPGRWPLGRWNVNGKRQWHYQVPEKDWNDWRWHFRNRITTVEQLERFIPLTDREKTQLRLVSTKYPFSITPYYLSLINFDDPLDPVRQQSLPDFEEVALADYGEDDPLDERDDSPVPGIVHRYPDRALFVITNICPLLCRHCTRKREWEDGNWVRPKAELDACIDYIRRTKSIRDVIISGGDPLTLSTPRLEEIVKRLRTIDHVEIIRFGTRFPVVLPQRIDDEFCEMVDKYGPIWLNTHFNHPNEVTAEAEQAVRKLLRAGVPVNNQSVLLRGINDSVETQLKLVHALMRIRVRPYYLYHADNVRGTEHLRTSVWKGIEIIEGMRGHTSGLAVPTFVVDVPGGGGKIPLQPNYLLSMTDDELVLRNYEGLVFRYRNPRAEGRPVLAGPAPLREAPAQPLVEVLTDRLQRRQGKTASRQASRVTHENRTLVRP